MNKILIAFLIFNFSTHASKSLGFYSDGTIKNSYHVRVDNNYTKLFQSRGQNFTSDEMASTLKTISNYIKSHFADAETMEVGDLSAESGGKINRHLSHQNGLDADIVYLRKNRSPSRTNPEWDEYFTNNKAVSKNYDEQRNWQVYKFLVKNFPVGRIFVDSKIKELHCKNVDRTQENIEVLRRLRPAKHHRTHLHLRLKCPKTSTKCKEQVEPPKGHGCNAISINDLSV